MVRKRTTASIPDFAGPGDLPTNTVNNDMFSNVVPISNGELEEIQLSLPQNKKLIAGRNYVKRKNITRRKDYWKSFIEYIHIPEDATKSKELRCECKFCNTTYACNGNTAGSKNVKKHYEKCLLNPINKGKGKQAELMFKPEFLASDEEGGEGKLKYGVINLTEVRQAIVEMIIVEELSFRFAESPGFVRVMEVACPKYTCQSCFTIARDVLKLYKTEKMMLKGVFRDSCQRVSITTDTWTSNQRLNYMCITTHFIDSEWKLQKRIINFCPITSYSGQSIGKGIEECLESWGIDGKLFTVTVDNAAPNNTACAYLGKMIERAEGIGKGKYIHIRCIAHIINLIVWDGIRDDQISINRIRNVVKYIRNSPARFQRLKDLGQRLSIDTKALLSQDCPTRWNSTYSMLNAACKLRRAIDGIELPPFDKPDEQVPTDEDWAKIEQLVVFLKGFYITTKRISGASYLTSSKGLIEISSALIMLNQWKQNRDEKMQSMAVVMRQKYDKYWGDFEKLNLMVYMAVILDPHCKFVIVELTLEDMFGVEKAKQLARDVNKFAYELFEEYKSIYSPLAHQIGESCDVASSSTQAGDGDEFNYARNVHERAKRMRGTIVVVSEFERYMSEQLGAEEDELDALDWWRLNGHRYPIVSRMAHDILSIPLSTVASESAFSAGGRTVDQFRSSLNPLSVQALICTQDWIRARNRYVTWKIT